MKTQWKWAVVLTLGLAACGRDNPPSNNNQSNNNNQNGANTLYAISGTGYLPGNDTASYVALVPNLEATTTIDYSKVLEIGGGGSVFGPSGAGFVLVGHSDAPTVTKYEVTAQNTFVEKETLNFGQYGIVSTYWDPGLAPVLSPTKAYFLDQSGLQVIVWNPSTMLIDRAFPIDGVADANYPNVYFEINPTKRGDEILIGVSPTNNDGATAPYSKLIFIDTINDRVARLEQDDRCGGLNDSVLDSKGDLYLSSGPYTAGQHRTSGTQLAPEPCMVRVKAGENNFDPTFRLKLSDLTGSIATGGIVGGGGDFAYVKALDESLVPFPITPDKFGDINQGAFWKWWRFPLGATSGAVVVYDVPPAASAGGEIGADGKVFVRNAADQYGNTTLLDMTAGEKPVSKISVRGFPFGIVRVR